MHVERPRTLLVSHLSTKMMTRSTENNAACKLYLKNRLLRWAPNASIYNLVFVPGVYKLVTGQMFMKTTAL